MLPGHGRPGPSHRRMRSALVTVSCVGCAREPFADRCRRFGGPPAPLVPCRPGRGLKGREAAPERSLKGTATTTQKHRIGWARLPCIADSRIPVLTRLVRRDQCASGARAGKIYDSRARVGTMTREQGARRENPPSRRGQGPGRCGQGWRERDARRDGRETFCASRGRRSDWQRIAPARAEDSACPTGSIPMRH